MVFRVVVKLVLRYKVPNKKQACQKQCPLWTLDDVLINEGALKMCVSNQILITFALNLFNRTIKNG